MYWATLMWWWLVYSQILPSPYSSSASPMWGCSHWPFWHQGIRPEIRRATQLYRLPNPHRIGFFLTHNYDPKSRTYCATATYNLTEVLVSPPSHINSWDNLPHFLFNLWILLTMEVQSLSSKDIIRPRCFKVSTFFNICSCSRNSVLVATRAELVDIWRHFHSAPLLHIMVQKFHANSVFWCMKISHWSHRGYVPVPLFRMIIASSMCWCIKSIHRLVQLVSITPRAPLNQAVYWRGIPLEVHPVLLWRG